MLGFTISAVLRSRMRFSYSAKPVPMMMPPMHWLSAVSLSRIIPQSCRQTILLTRVTPVSMSTSTSANWTPLVPTVASVRSNAPSPVTEAIPS